MDLGAEFDDDCFEKPKQKQSSCISNYEAKVCVPFWFMEADLVAKETSDRLVALKHQADYHYFSKNYVKAIETYERCLELVPPSNNTWKREFMENLARASLQIEDAEKALEWSLKLDKSSFSPDQKIVSMNLLAAVCHKLGKYEEELEALHCCIEVHKACPEFWQRLGLCYAGLFKIFLPDYSIKKPGEAELCCDFSSKRSFNKLPQSEESVALVCPTDESAIICGGSSANSDKCPSATSSEVGNAKCDLCTLGTQIVSSCLIHTKMLIDSSGPNHLNIERDERIKEKIANSLKHMEVDQSFIEVASQMLGSDFLSGLQRQEGALEQHNTLTTNLEKEEHE